jgi:hypothetical protein
MSGRSGFFAACALFLFGINLAARADEFDKIRLQTQKLLGEVNEAMGKARALETRDPAKAREVLRDVLFKLEDATFMEEKQRRHLVSQVNNRIDYVTRLIQERRRAEEKAAERAADRDRRERFDNVRQPALPGAQAPKGTPSSIAADRIKSGQASEEYLARVKAAREAGLSATLNDVQASANATEQRITQYYIDRAMKRAETTLTKEEKTILKALNSVMTPNFERATLKEVMVYLMDKTGVPILVDENALKEVNITYDEERVDLKLTTKVSVRTILRAILKERRLAYVVKEGAINVVTADQARTMMTTRSYPVGDLVTPDPRLGLLAPLALQQNVQSLIAMIQRSTDPTIWDNSPNGAQITFFPATMSLVVRAPAEMHLMMGFGSAKR